MDNSEAPHYSCVDPGCQRDGLTSLSAVPLARSGVTPSPKATGRNQLTLKVQVPTPATVQQNRTSSQKLGLRTWRQQHHARAGWYKRTFLFKRFCTGGLDARAGLSALAGARGPAGC